MVWYKKVSSLVRIVVLVMFQTDLLVFGSCVDQVECRDGNVTDREPESACWCKDYLQQVMLSRKGRRGWSYLCDHACMFGYWVGMLKYH